jgi:hypothetical protein
VLVVSSPKGAMGLIVGFRAPPDPLPAPAEAAPAAVLACRSCGVKLALPEGLAGALCKCPRCGAEFVAPAPVDDVSMLSASSPATPALLITAPQVPGPDSVAGTPPARAGLSGCRALALLLLVALGAPGVGLAVLAEYERYAERREREQEFRITAGMTQAQVAAALGAPHERSRPGAGEEVWTYRRSRRGGSAFHVWFDAAGRVKEWGRRDPSE